MPRLVPICVLAVVFCTPVLAQTVPLTGGLPGIDGLAPAQGPAPAAPMPGNLPVLNQTLLALPMPDSRRDSMLPPLTGGVPGLDGLNASPKALRNALGGLDPAVIDVLFRNASPALHHQIRSTLGQPLSGLDAAPAAEGAVPGLDGLPVGGRRADEPRPDDSGAD